MRDYKVGDTIYVKGKITDVDHNETMLPYCVVSSPNYHFWASQESVIDELPPAEPVKPVLPKKVADEMEAYKGYGDDFNEYIYNVMAVPDTHYLIKTHDTFIRSNVTVETLLNAWNNGYTVEKPKLYNLVLGKNMWGWPLALYKPTGNDNNLIAYPDATPKHLRDSMYQFTQEEIDKYNKNFWINNIDLNDYKELVADD